MFNGASLLILITILAVTVWAFWPQIRVLLSRITTDLFQDIPETHPEARTGLDVLEAEGVIAAAVHRGGGSVDTVAYAIRHHGGAA